METKGSKRIKIEEETRVKNKLLVTTPDFKGSEPITLQCLIEFQPNQPTEKERFLLDLVGMRHDFDPCYERGPHAAKALGTYFFTKYGKSEWTKDKHTPWELLEEFLDEHGGECEIMDKGIRKLIEDTRKRYDWIIDVCTETMEDDKDDILEDMGDYLDCLKDLLEEDNSELQGYFKNNPGLEEKISDLSIEDFKLD
jgi:hypothetical protein